MQMTEEQFDEAVDQLEQAGLAGVDGNEQVARVFAAAEHRLPLVGLHGDARRDDDVGAMEWRPDAQ